MTSLQNWLTQLFAWFRAILYKADWVQLGIVLAAIPVAQFLQFLLWRYFVERQLYPALKEPLAQVSWLSKLFTVVRKLLQPVLAFFLLWLAILIFTALGWSSDLILAVLPLIPFWLIYRAVSALLQTNLAPEPARFWTRNVALPVIIITAILQLTGLLDQILSAGINAGGIQITIGSILAGLSVLIIFYFVAGSARRYLVRIFLPHTNISSTLADALSKLVAYIIVFIGLLVALTSMGINLTSMTLIVSGLSVGLGFGMQQVVSNFMSGFILMFEEAIGPGDTVVIDDETGIVQHVGMRSIIIKTRDNVELVIPNARFMTDTVTNMTRSDNIVRIRISVGVSYNSDPHEVQRALLEAAQHPRVLSEPAPTVQFVDFGNSSLNFDLLVWSDDYFRIQVLASEIRYQIWDSLQAHGIEIPFPQRDLHIRSGVPWDDLTKRDQATT